MSRRPDKTAAEGGADVKPAPAAKERPVVARPRKAKAKSVTGKSVAGKSAVAKSAVAKPAVAKPAVAKSATDKSATDKPAATPLETTIAYRFSDQALLERALTHISALKGQSRSGSYQRLEFLGDHVLGLVISEMLFAAFPKADEGELSRRLADLVRRESCADVARLIDLGSALKLGTSEARAGGRSKAAILADVCESLIGAIFLDGGYEAGKSFVERYWAERMRKPSRPLRDPKTVLQEWAQGRGLPTPDYHEVERTGPHHDPVFRIAVTLPDRDPAEGKGRSKRAAEQAAAAALLAREGVDNEG
jgi:ribonuclease-3